MISRQHLFAGLIVMMIIGLISCSGSGPSNDTPLAPGLTTQAEPTEAGRYLWAYYEIAVDPAANTFEITPLRATEDHWNILKFLEQGPCTNCVAIVNMANSDHGTKLFDVQISHPFPSANLTGFDVRGIAMFGASHNFPVSGLSTPDRFAGDGELVNAQGFTTLYNATTAGDGPGGLQGYLKGKYTPAMTPNALLNGYIRHISPGMANTRNAFYSNSSVIETYDIDMPDSQFIFGYAVDASWANPTTKPVTNVNEDFPPEANCPEPWNIELHPLENVTLQGLTDEGGEAKLTIDVYDYQGKSTFFAPVVECHDLFDGPANAVWEEDGDGYTRYSVNLENENLAEAGEYLCLVSVEDTANATSPEWLDLTAYQVTRLTVAEFQVQANQPPTAAAHADNYNPTLNQTVNFSDDSTDPDGYTDIVKWEWDFTFEIMDGFLGSEGPANPSLPYDEVGTFYVQLRVTDSENHTDMLDTPLEITVTGSGNTPPVACGDADNTHPNINTLIHFYDCSIDEDGLLDMVYYEWDLDGDGFYEKNIKDVTKIYNEGGDYLVQHRVTDSADNVDILDEPILIEVNGPPEAIAGADNLNPSFGDPVVISSASVDLDGNGPIENILWDLNGDGDYNDTEELAYEDEQEITLYFFEGGIQNIGLKVIDQYGLEDELDAFLQIDVVGFDPFCVELQDQYDSADELYGNRVFNYYQGAIGDVPTDYKAANGPWDFTDVPIAQPAICEWFTPSNCDNSTPVGIWPGADFFFKEAAPVAGGSIYAPHTFVFDPPDGNYLQLDGQWQPGQTIYYNEVFQISHPICNPWMDSGSGSGNMLGLPVDISWTMTSLGTGPAIFVVDGEPTILNCMLLRHNISFVDTEYGAINFSLLNYQWIDEDGNEVAFMEATNGLSGTNFSGNSYTGEVICRSLKSIT